MEDYLSLTFDFNAFEFNDFIEGQKGELRFYGVSLWRIGSTNDEGWYLGQCRFSGVAPSWGEFYKVDGELKLNEAAGEWRVLSQGVGGQHFLFYLRDSTFECSAESYELFKCANT